MNWIVHENWQTPDYFPNENIVVNNIDWKSANTLIARWTENFDSNRETNFWYCIMDKPFDLNSIRAKERYEINKGNKFFYTKCINPHDYIDEIYHVYVESMKGYYNITPQSKDVFFDEFINRSMNNRINIGVFDRLSNKLCGYSDIYDNGIYIPIYFFKTMVSEEKKNVNFALMYGIVSFFNNKIKNGSFLSDGCRNVFHQTNFQLWLERYFGFRKAYCDLHVAFRFPYKYAFLLIYPFRRLLKNNHNLRIRQLYSSLKLYAWSKGEIE